MIVNGEEKEGGTGESKSKVDEEKEEQMEVNWDARKKYIYT